MRTYLASREFVAPGEIGYPRPQLGRQLARAVGGPDPFILPGDILPLVLARLGVGELQSTESGERDST